MTRSYEAIVIGGGPGGYVAAIKLGQLGLETALVEKGSIGGVCLNWGCIPSKALIHVADTVSHLQDASIFGVTANEISVDVEKTRAWKDEIVRKLTDGIRRLIKGNRVDIIEGKARFTSDRSLSVEAKGGETQEIAFQKCIVATGARPIEIPGFEVDGETIWGAQHALDIPHIPGRMLVIGGGVIGLEIGTVYAKLGTKVTIVEMLDGLLPGIDRDLVRVVERRLRQLGVTVMTKARAKSLEKLEDGLRVAVEATKDEEIVECDRVLVATGFTPGSEGIGLDAAGIETEEKGAIKVDKTLQTNVSGIYAVGDVTGPPYLAHRASKMAEIAAEHAAGHDVTYDVKSVPSAVYTDPEIAVTGLSEEQAKEQKREVKTGRFMLGANGRALGAGQPHGHVKVVADPETGAILGAGVAGHTASEIISELTLAIEMGAGVETVGSAIHPHPTISESIPEACMAAVGKAIHAINRPTRPKRGK